MIEEPDQTFFKLRSKFDYEFDFPPQDLLYQWWNWKEQTVRTLEDNVALEVDRLLREESYGSL